MSRLVKKIRKYFMHLKITGKATPHVAIIFPRLISMATKMVNILS